MEDMDSGFEEFAAAFDGDGNQTESTEDTTQTETTDTAGESGGDEQRETGSEPTGQSGEGSAKEEGSEGSGEPGKEEKPGGEQTFTIRVNKEDRTVNLQEMTTLAQKGADYDRVKEKLEAARNTERELREKLGGQQEIMNTLELISGQSKLPVQELVEQVYVNFLKGTGKTEAEARADIRAARLERELNDLKDKQAQKQTREEESQSRAQKEVAEFRQRFPEVELTEELCGKLMADVQAGMSLSQAYQKMESARKDAEIAELQRQLEAERQNKKNRVSSPGSQTDSGGQRQKTDFDEFMAAFL